MDGDSGEHGILDCRMTVGAPGIPGPHWSEKMLVGFRPKAFKFAQLTMVFSPHITENLPNSNTPKLDGL